MDFGELAKYRSLKKQKAMLNNDHLALKKEIEKGLFSLHAGYKENSQNDENVEIKTETSFKKDKKEQNVVYKEVPQ